ncbi:MAG: DNA alkylation repair protein [Eubacteriaceae bacterium]|nr:DNA alkylation repair protein [Eubacteriaceae bacterium]
MNITDELRKNSDISYRDFQSSLIPNVAKETFIGVRTPIIRDMAKRLVKNNTHTEFLNALPHEYYDENMLHGAIISEMKDFEEVMSGLEKFLPYVDNWAVCDMINPKVLGKNKEKLLPAIRRYISSSHTYTIRFGIRMLMVHFLGSEYKKEYSDMVAEIRSEEYYVNMMIAWYFQSAVVKNYDDIIPYFQNNTLPTRTHNKAIQKCVESLKVEMSTKEYLKSLKK